MKKGLQILLPAILLPCIALAAATDDYATQWSLAADDGAGAYRVILDAGVYQAAHLPSLGDVDILDAAGNPVPATLLDAPAPRMADSTRHALPLFPLPVDEARVGGGVSLDIERNPDGSLRRVGTSISEPATQAGPVAWLLDASVVKGPIAALELSWAPVASGFDVRYRIEGSDDLRDWRTLQSGVPLVDLARDGQRLQQRTLPVGAHAKYLRLVPAGGSGHPVLTEVRADVAGVATAPAWQWQSLSGTATDAGNLEFEFVLDGRFPVEVAEVSLPGNSAAQWTLYSRDDEASPWRQRAGPWVSYRIGDAGAERSAPQSLSSRVRDRHWRLVGTVRAPETPVLRLGWAPESIVFVAQGSPPYRLVAGSARASRASAPVSQLLDAIRGQRGPDWQPTQATLGTSSVLAGDAALQPLEKPRDWRTWLLWGVLVLGALLVAGFAVSLLRQPARRTD